MALDSGAPPPEAALRQAGWRAADSQSAQPHLLRPLQGEQVNAPRQAGGGRARAARRGRARMVVPTYRSRRVTSRSTLTSWPLGVCSSSSPPPKPKPPPNPPPKNLRARPPTSMPGCRRQGKTELVKMLSAWQASACASWITAMTSTRVAAWHAARTRARARRRAARSAAGRGRRRAHWEKMSAAPPPPLPPWASCCFRPSSP